MAENKPNVVWPKSSALDGRDSAINNARTCNEKGFLKELVAAAYTDSLGRSENLFQSLMGGKPGPRNHKT